MSRSTSSTSSTRSRFLGVLFVLALAAALWATPAFAANGTWTGAAGTQIWGGTGNWVSSIIADGAGFTASFVYGYTTNQTLSVNTNRTIGNITFTDTEAGTLNNLTLTKHASDYTLTLNNSGSSPVINVTQSDRTLTIYPKVAGTAGLTKSGPGKLVLAGADAYTGATIISAGTLNLTGSLTGGTAISTSGTSILDESALGVISGAASITQGSSVTSILAGANSYTGATIVSAGTLSLTGSLSGGTAISTSGTGVLSESVVTGLISGAASITQGSSGISTLAGANSYTGATIVNAGTLVISGSPAGNSAVTVNGGTLTLDYTTNTGKIYNSAILTLGGGTLNLSGGSHLEVVGSTTLTAGTASIVTRPLGTAVLQMNAITRGAGASINFGAASIANTDTLNTNGILGTWATIGGTDWAANSTNLANGPITAPAYTDVTRLDIGPKVIVDDSATNVRIIEGTGSLTNITLGAATTTINTLNQSASGGLATIDPASQTLLTNGILLGTGAGGLTIGTGTNNGTLTTATAGGDLLLINNTANALTINSDIANNTSTSTLTKKGTGPLALNGANSYDGATTLQAGTLTLGNASALGTGALTISGGNLDSSVVDLVNMNNNAQAWNADFTFGGTQNLNLGTGGVTMSANRQVTVTAKTLTVGGAIGGGAFSLTKAGAGTLVLTGPNTFTGAINVNAGQLNLTNWGASTLGTVTVAGTSILEISGGATYNIATRMSVGATTNGTVNQTGGTVSFTASDCLLVGTGTGSTGIYNLSGGTITSFTSGTRGVMIGVNASNSGTFNLSGEGNLSLSNSILMIGRSDSVAANCVALFSQTGGTATVGTLTIGGTGAGNTNSTMSLTGGTFAATNFTKLAIATNDITAINIGVAADVTLPAFPTARGSGATATVTFDGGTLRPSATSAAYMGGLTNAFIKAGGAKFDVASTKDITITQFLLTHGSSTGGGLTKAGAGALTLTGGNTYTGATTVNAGTLVAGTDAPSGSAGAFGKATSEVNLGEAGGSSDAGILIGGAFNIFRNVRIRTADTADAGARVLTLGGNTANTSEFAGNIFLGTANQAGRGVTLTAASGGQVIFSGVIQDPAGMDVTAYTVTKAGLGTVVLSGANTYTGATAVSAGTLTLDYSTENNSKLADANSLVLGGGTLDLKGGTHTEIVGSTTLTAGTASSVTSSTPGSVLQMNAITRGAGATITFGASGIATTDTLNTNGILGPWAIIGGTDFAANSTNDANGPITPPTYTPVTRRDGGTQVIADDATTNVRIIEGSGSLASITLGAATTTINTLNQSAIDGNSAVTIDPAGQTFRTNTILVGTGAGALTIGTGTNNGTVTTPTAGGDLLLVNNTANTLTINSVIADNATTPLSTTGNVLLTGVNTYTGATSVGSGTLEIGGVGQLNSGNYSGTITIFGGATFKYNSDANQILGGAVSGGGGLAKGGAGELTLSAVNTYTGATSITAGTLKIDGSGQLGGGVYAAAITNDGAFNFASSAAQTLSGTISGIGSLTVSGAGTLTLTGANDYSGGTTVSTGTLIAQTTALTTNSLGTGAASIGGGSTLRLNNLQTSGTTAIGNTFTGSGRLIVNFAAGTTARNTGLTGVAGFTGTIELANAGANGDKWNLDSAGVNAPGATVQVDSGSTMYFPGGTSTFAGITVAGAGNTENRGAFRLSGSSILNGPVTLSGDATIASDSTATPSPELSGNISATGAYTLTIGHTSAAGNITLSGILSDGTGTLSLTKTTAGTLTLSGANTYGGATTITAGTLQFKGAASLPAASAVSLGVATLQYLDDGAGNNGTITRTWNDITLSAAGTASTIINVGNNGSANTGNTVAFGALNNGTALNNFASTINFTASNGYLQSYSSLGLSGLLGNNTTLNPTTTSVIITGNVTNQESSTVTGHYDTLTLGGTSTGNAINGAISDSAGYVSVGNGDTRVTKSGAGTWTLSGANTYNGPTTISAGTLRFARQVSLYNNNTGGGWTAANINVKSAATLALNVDSAGTDGFTSASLDTLLGNISVANTATEGLQAGAILGFDTSTATAGTFTHGNAIANSTGASGGAISVTKLGTGTLTLSGANTYTGTTTIGDGTLAFTTTDQWLTGGLTFGISNGSTTTGALDLPDASATFGGAFLVRTNSATANTISIGATKTLTLSGGLTLGYDAAGGTGQTDSKLTVTGGGSMAVNGTTINISVNQAATNAAYWSKGTLDVSALAAFSTNVTDFNIGVGNNSQGPGDVILSNTANTILATTLTVGNTGANNGRGTSTLTLGTGTNVIQADTINIGRNKGSGPGVVTFASTAPGSPGTVTITDKAGSGRANIDIANQLTNGTAVGAVGTLDLRGHVATVSAGTVAIGSVAASGGTGSPSGTLSFDAGTFDVNTLNLAPKSGNGTGTSRATVNIGGGSFTVNTAFTLGSQAGNGASVATLNLTGGTLSSAVSILDGGGNTTSKITLDGGTLNMNGNAIGGAVAIDTLEFKSGGLQNVSQINDGAIGLTKTTTGTLVLAGTNAYSGGTTVNAGTLLVSGAVAMPTTGTLQVNAGGNFSLANGPALATTTTAALGLASGALLTFDWNGGSLDMLTSTAAATTAGTVGININNNSPTGSGGMLINSPLGGLTTAGGTQYFLANNTNYTATLAVTDTDVSIDAQSAVTALTNAYWKGGQLTGGALGAMALSSGTSSNWATDANGTSAGGVVPGGSAVNVIFGASGATEQANVTTGADMNLGSITFNDSTAVTIGGSHIITLNSTLATAATSSGSGTTVITPGSAITVTSSANAANTINANIQLDANQIWNIYSGKTLTVGGSVGGTGTLTLADAGTLILTGANTYSGATTISAGTMQLGDGTTGKDGTIGNTSGVTNDAALVFNRFGSSIAGYAISGTGTVTKLGAGTQALSGTNTYIGATTISAGTLQFAKEVSLYNNNTAGTGWTAANIVVGNSGTLALNVGGTDEFTTTDVTTLLTALGGANGTSTAGFAAGSKIAFDTTNASGGTFTVADLIADSSGIGGGAIGLTKLGTNTLTLTNANTYSGVTTISAGTLALNVNTATLGNTAAGTVVQSGAALKLQASMTLDEALTLSGTGVGTTDSTYGALVLNVNTAAIILNGAITLSGGAAINTYNAGLANVQIAKGIGGTGDLTLRASAAGNGGALYRLQDQSNYDGNTTFSTQNTSSQGITVQNEIENALPTTTVLTIAAAASQNAIYRLNGYNQTVAGMQISGTGTLNAIVGGSATLSTLTVNNSGNYTFAGKLGNTGTDENNLALVKSGVGTLTLDSNTSTFTGDITINRGTLVAAVATPNNTAPATALGDATSSARTITVNTDGTLEFDAGNVMTHNFASNNVPSLVVAGGTVTNGGSATNNALGSVTLNGGTLTATVGSTSGYGSWNLNGTVASTGASLISSTASVPIALSAVSGDDNTTTFDVQSGTLTVSAALGQVTASGDERTSGLTKTGVGTLVLAGVNTYTGNTTVSDGTLELADGAGLKFVIGANGVNNKITGTGTVDLAGDFTFDLTAAVVAVGNTWKIVDNAVLAETYQSSFSVIGFTGGEGAGVLWTKSAGGGLMWEFRESTGELRNFVPGDTNNDFVVDAADYIAVKTNFGMPSGATRLQGDLDGDFDVDWDDLQDLMNAMATRSVGGAPPAPEPATLGLLAIGALALLRRRRK